jgi:hypothetical protein
MTIPYYYTTVQFWWHIEFCLFSFSWNHLRVWNIYTRPTSFRSVNVDRSTNQENKIHCVVPDDSLYVYIYARTRKAKSNPAMHACKDPLTTLSLMNTGNPTGFVLPGSTCRLRLGNHSIRSIQQPMVACASWERNDI